jgi:CHAT domain-containing protein/TPR repeat protein
MTTLRPKALQVLGILFGILITNSSLVADTAESAASMCQLLAGYPYFPDTKDPGKLDHEIDFSKAFEACGKAVLEAPSDGHLSFLVARTYASIGQFDEANSGYLYSAELNYGGGYFGLAEVLVSSDPDFEPNAVLGLLMKASDLGFWPADVELAQLYLNEGNFDEAYRILEDSIAHRYPPALVTATEILLRGSPSPDSQEIERLLVGAAEAGYAPGIFKLAHFYLDTNDDLSPAVPYLNELSERGNAKAKLWLAKFLFKMSDDGRDSEQARGLLIQSARLGSEEAQILLGLAYWNGSHGFAQSFDAANQWLIAAAEQGSAFALRDLGVRLHRGDRIEHDPQKAVEYLTAAAAAGDEDAARYLGLAFWAGTDGIDRDYSKALNYLMPLALAGDIEALGDAAMIYADERQEPTDLNKSVEFFLKAGKAIVGAEYLTSLYWPDVRAEHFEAAIDLLERCYELEQDPKCAKALGDIFKNPAAPQVDYLRAVEWLERAAQTQHIPALIALSRMYIDGEGVAPNLEHARTYLARVEQAYEASVEKRPDELIELLRAQGYLNYQLGNYLEAENKYQKLVLLQDADDLEDGLTYAEDLMRLAVIYLSEGRPEAALRFYNRIGELEAEDEVGAALLKFMSDSGRAGAHFELGEVERARAIRDDLLADEDLNATLSSLFGSDGWLLASAGAAYFGFEDYTKAAESIGRALPKMSALFGPSSSDTLILKSFLGISLGNIGQFDEAENHLKAVIDSAESREIFDPIQLLQARSYVAKFDAQRGKRDQAFLAIEQVIADLSRLLKSPQSSLSVGNRSANSAVKEILATYAQIKPRNAEATSSKSAERAFEIAQLSTELSVVRPIERRIALGRIDNPQIKEMIAEVQQLEEQWHALDHRFRQAATSPQQLGEKELVGVRLQEIEDQIHALTDRLSKKGYDYFSIGTNNLLSLTQVQNSLQRSELILQFMTARSQTLVWSISRESSQIFVADLPLERLRQGLAEIQRSVDLLGKSELPAYAADQAHYLYKMLIEPALFGHSGIRKLIVIPDGPLVGLPFPALITDRGDSDSWLIEKYAVALIPSIGSLTWFKGQLGRSKAPKPFLGVGNPALSQVGESVQNRIEPFRGYYDLRGEANLEKIRNLPSLPDTENELQRIGKYLGAAQSDIFVGERATEPAIRKLALDDYRVIAFATHGLIGGEISGLSEPALVLSPPEEILPDDDGLLTASEIGLIQLDADLVVLSACNTASRGREDDATGLSGLARAFFLAGARNILVSNWYVESNAAVKITTQLFKKAVENGDLSYAEALRLAILDLLSNPESSLESHPAYWAPFVVVGL